jgi:hypothetical protein
MSLYVHTTLDRCYQCEGAARAAQLALLDSTGVSSCDVNMRCELLALTSKEGGGLTIPNVAELKVTVFLSAVVGEACTHRQIGVQQRENIRK